MTTLELSAIHKRFGAVSALRGVSLRVDAPEVVALLGDNGAGKSTLAKIIAGALAPDAGTITIDGSEVSFNSPRDAARRGIDMTYQDLALVDTLDVASNMFLGHELRRPGLLGRLGLLDKARMRAESRSHLDGLSSQLGSPSRPVEVLSRGQRQAVAVARAALRVRAGARLVIMDEPTASLGVVQTRRVTELIGSLHSSGVAVILVSHNLPLCFALATRLVVMHQGAIVSDQRPQATTLERVVAQMTEAPLGATTVGVGARANGHGANGRA